MKSNARYLYNFNLVFILFFIDNLVFVYFTLCLLYEKKILFLKEKQIILNCPEIISFLRFNRMITDIENKYKFYFKLVFIFIYKVTVLKNEYILKY